MAGIFSSTTQKKGDYFMVTGTKSQSPELQETSTISWAPSSPDLTAQDFDLDLDFVNEIFSNTSNITTPTTSIESDPDLPSSSLHAQKRKQIGKVEEPIREEDFGTFEDWMRWDEPEATTGSMNNSNTTSTQADDSVVFIEDPVSNSPLFQPRSFAIPQSINSRIENTSSSFDNLNLIGIPPRATVFNSPAQLVAAPIWPQPPQQYPQQTFFASALSPQEEARLRSIAMPHLNTNSTFSPTDYQSPLSSSDHGHTSKRPTLRTSTSSRCSAQRKRKSIADDSLKHESVELEEDNMKDPSPSSSSANTNTNATLNLPMTKGKKTSHNMIEKRYRNNLNDKITELRDSVPSLRVMSHKQSTQLNSDNEGEDEEEELDGLTPAHRLNKATILSKATEYINHLERRNDSLAKENAGLKARVDAFEILMMSRQQAVSMGVPYQYAVPMQQQQQQQPHPGQALGQGQQGQYRGW